MFLFHFHGLWCPVYCQELFCWFALVSFIIWLPYLDNLFHLILVHCHTSVHCLIYPCFLANVYCSWARTLSYLFMYCSVASVRHADMMCSTVSSNFWHSLHWLSVSVSVSASYFVCNAWSFAAIISRSVSLVRSPLDSHGNVSSMLISCLSVLLIYWPCLTFFSYYSSHYCCFFIMVLVTMTKMKFKMVTTNLITVDYTKQRIINLSVCISLNIHKF
jgi:hypothetical protein